MGYKILDVKADIHEDVESYFTKLGKQQLIRRVKTKSYWEIRGELLDIVDKHFEKIER